MVSWAFGKLLKGPRRGGLHREGGMIRAFIRRRGAARVGTGPLVFSLDTKGVFIRGEMAQYYAHMLSRLMGIGTQRPDPSEVHQLIWLLESAAPESGVEAQVMRAYEASLIGRTQPTPSQARGDVSRAVLTPDESYPNGPNAALNGALH
jgi:hypothetical protein